MKLLWDHLYRKQEKQDLVVCRPHALFYSHEEEDALENGWLLLDGKYKNYKEVWYQSRSTRLNLSKNKLDKKEFFLGEDRVNMSEIHPKIEDTAWTGMHQIYKDYIKRKGFSDLYNPFEHVGKRDSFLVYYLNNNKNKLIGFTKIRKYIGWDGEIEHYRNPYTELSLFPDEEHMYLHHCSMESVIHCNTVQISQISLDMEIQMAKEREMDHLYLGSGYESSSEYKANYEGFEWWNGIRWSTSKKTYRKLCRRDSEITRIEDLPSSS